MLNLYLLSLVVNSIRNDINEFCVVTYLETIESHNKFIELNNSRQHILLRLLDNIPVP